MTETPATTDGAPLFPLMFGISGPLGLPVTTPGEVARLVDDALAGGVNAFDTSPAYGGGEAERRLGNALRGRTRASYFLSSKVGTIQTAPRRYKKDFSLDAMRRSIEASLERLGTDYLDLLVLHGPGPEHLTHDLFAALAAWRAEGLFRSLGAAVRGLDAIQMLHEPEIAWVMASVRRDMDHPEKDALAAHRKVGRHVIGIETLRPAQPRWRAPTRPSDLFYLARDLVAPSRTQHRETPQGALGWALTAGPCDFVCVTTTRRTHLAANIAVARGVQSVNPSALT